VALQKFAGPGADNSSSARSMTSCPLLAKFPTVGEFLSMSQWPDGSPRETGTITLLFDSGQVKAAVNDRDANVSAFVSAESLTGLFKALEEGLTEGRLIWRAKKEYTPKKR
jgi:hypothetical protein